MSNKTEIEMVASIIEYVTDARNKWFSEHDPDGVKEKVFKHLDGCEREVFNKLLGFDKSWGNDSWEIDHCNGRNGNSIVGEYLKSEHLNAVHEWLNGLVGNIDDYSLPKKELADIRRGIIHDYKYQLRKRVMEKLEHRINMDAEEILNSVMEKCVDVRNQKQTIEFAFTMIEGLEKDI